MRLSVDISKYAFRLSLALFIFAYGIAVGVFQVFPYEFIKFAYNSVNHVKDDFSTLAGIRPELYLKPARYDGNGVTVLDPGRAAPGMTLLYGLFDGNPGLKLMRLDGTIVRQWPALFHDIFEDTSHIKPTSNVPATNWNVGLQGALALQDGSVVFNFGYLGMVKLNRCGAVEWTVSMMTHHSLEPAETGGFWVPGRNYVEGRTGFPPLSTPYEEDTILNISPDGEVSLEISVPKLLFENGMQAILFANGHTKVEVPHQELVHLNKVEELSSSFADAFPDFNAGDLLLSLRNLNLLMIVDPKTRKIKYHQTGPWIRQHDPDFRADGLISMFNNNTDGTVSGKIFGGSNISVLDPTDRSVTYFYGAREGEQMYSEDLGKHQVLDNGNVLIVEARSGRVFEVTADGDIVWEFINRYEDDRVAMVTDALRYSDDYFTVDNWSCIQ